MSKFFLQTTQCESLGRAFTTEQVAKGYGTTEANIRQHKRLQADELIRGLHFETSTNKFGTNETLWTLRGIIKLGMFIRSKEAKHFRLWAEQELEKSINKELENARQTKALSIKQAQHHQNIVNGYKSQIIQHNAQIVELKAKLAEQSQLKEPRVDFDAVNQVLQRAMHHTLEQMQKQMQELLEQTKKELYKNATNTTLAFHKLTYKEKEKE